MASPDFARHSIDARQTLRHKFGKKLAGIGLGLVVAGGTMGLAGCVEVKAPTAEAYLGSCNAKINSSQAAGAVLLARMSGPGQEITNDNFLTLAHGGIYQDEKDGKPDGDPWLATTSKFTDAIRQEDGEVLTATFCDKDGKTHRRDIAVGDGKRSFAEINGNSIVVFPLPDLISDDLNEAVDAGKITPLGVTSIDSLTEGQLLGIDNAGELAKLYTTVGTNLRSKDYPQVKFKNGEICDENLGASLLVLDKDGNPTGKAVGQVIAGDILSDNGGCSTVNAFFIPFDSTKTST